MTQAAAAEAAGGAAADLLPLRRRALLAVGRVGEAGG